MADKESSKHIPLLNVESISPSESPVSTVSKAGKPFALSRLCRYQGRSSSLFDIKKVTPIKEDVFVGDLMLSSRERKYVLNLIYSIIGSNLKIKQLLSSYH